ncbi:N6-adenosine-methyltransferase MT-A70-like protein [Tanacetum coccineum]
MLWRLYALLWLLIRGAAHSVVESEEGVKKIEEIAAVDGAHMMMGVPKPIKSLRLGTVRKWRLVNHSGLTSDIRNFRMDILGRYGVIMADPPWDIHMELPYGTMADDEMRGLNIQALQTDGLIFLWVTGRAMELGRE